MAQAKITKKVLDMAEIISNKRYEIWDAEIKGFTVEVNPSGRKTFYLRFSDGNKKKQKIKIGVFGNITCDEARDIAKGWHGDIARGINPKEKKKESKITDQQSIYFEEYFELFRQQYILKKHKPSTIDRNKSRIQKHILPFFGKKRIGEIIQNDVLHFVDSLKHIKGNCTKCLRLLNTAFNQAELWGYREKNSNPCKGVPKYPDKMMERFLTKEELHKLEEILKHEELYRLKSPYALAAIRMLVYTGCRMGEILTLKWEDIDFNDNCIHLKDSKTGKRTIALNEVAKEVLNSVEKQEGNPYVFCGTKAGTHLAQIDKAWQKIRKSAGLPDVRIHDLRHSFACFMIKNGVSLFEVSKLLGHKDIKTTMRYLHLANRELVEVANKGGQIFKGALTKLTSTSR